ncbi:hypothetical protein RBS12_04930 [Sinomonas sp. ASV322]|nr:hypothetical protein [Sinomonas sp. ASV322]MDQ4501658.1 hypothetical protein [Sinomonas sp. ASV322]
MSHRIRKPSDRHAASRLGLPHSGKGRAVVNRIHGRTHGVLDTSIAQALEAPGILTEILIDHAAGSR